MAGDELEQESIDYIDSVINSVSPKLKRSPDGTLFDLNKVNRQKLESEFREILGRKFNTKQWNAAEHKRIEVCHSKSIGGQLGELLNVDTYNYAWSGSSTLAAVTLLLSKVDDIDENTLVIFGSSFNDRTTKLNGLHVSEIDTYKELIKCVTVHDVTTDDIDAYTHISNTYYNDLPARALSNLLTLMSVNSICQDKGASCAIVIPRDSMLIPEGITSCFPYMNDISTHNIISTTIESVAYSMSGPTKNCFGHYKEHVYTQYINSVLLPFLNERKLK